jgi:hypothetical protein
MEEVMEQMRARMVEESSMRQEREERLKEAI